MGFNLHRSKVFYYVLLTSIKRFSFVLHCDQPSLTASFFQHEANPIQSHFSHFSPIQLTIGSLPPRLAVLLTFYCSWHLFCVFQSTRLVMPYPRARSKTIILLRLIYYFHWVLTVILFLWLNPLFIFWYGILMRATVLVPWLSCVCYLSPMTFTVVILQPGNSSAEIGDDLHSHPKDWRSITCRYHTIPHLKSRTALTYQFPHPSFLIFSCVVICSLRMQCTSAQCLVSMNSRRILVISCPISCLCCIQSLCKMNTTSNYSRKQFQFIVDKGLSECCQFGRKWFKESNSRYLNSFCQMSSKVRAIATVCRRWCTIKAIIQQICRLGKSKILSGISPSM